MASTLSNRIASAVMFASTIGAGVAVTIVGPRYFVDSKTGDVDYISAAVPFFILLIFIELALLVATRFPSVGGQHVFADSWSSLASGTVQRMCIMMFSKTFIKTAVPSITYPWIWDNYALFRCSYDSPWTWLATILLVDFAYYWTHRAGHQVSLLWAGHSVHHSSEHYNLTTALRQSVWQHMYESFSFVPAALFFPPKVYFVMLSWNTIYQFWVHTCLIRRVGVFEYVLMTPSHHRVHHDRRVHKNYGGLLIIWDKLFGTFLDEDQPANVNTTADVDVCAFGIMPVLATWSDAVLQLTLWQSMLSKSFSSLLQGNMRAALSSLFIGPGYYTTTAPRTLVGMQPASRLRHTDTSPLLLKVYVGLHFTALVTAAFAAFVFAPITTELLVFGVAIIASLTIQGFMLDQRPFSVVLEVARCLAIAAACKFCTNSILLQAVPASLLDASVILFMVSALSCIVFPSNLVTTWKSEHVKTP
eukprot:m.235039 g.235039  ORF g.235039 m.235039 type:complete len:474 (-) comp19868_c0_seq1:45-1466(-)